VDDLPVHGALPKGETRQSVTEAMLSHLKAAGVPDAFGFTNGAHLADDPGLENSLRAWSEAGYTLGNHSWSHKNLNDIGAAEFEAELIRNEPLLERYSPGKDWRWYRYPFLSEGQDPAKREAARKILAKRGYRIAGVTMDFSDWQWSDAYARCRDRNDLPGLAALESAYLESVREAIGRSRSISRAVHGRDIPYVLLTHVSPFNARMFGRVLSLFREEGFQFTTLQAAQRDPAYERDTNPSLPPEGKSLEERAAERGLQVPTPTDRTPMLNAACR
jgi:peptidoglycan/xylan/chitin deacetylase (PgdA/CDA1 family)